MSKSIKLKNNVYLDALSVRSKIFEASTRYENTITWQTAWTMERVIYNNIKFNTLGATMSNGIITIPINAMLRITATFNYYNNQLYGDKNLHLFVNGNDNRFLCYGNYSDSAYCSVSGTCFLAVSAGDTIEIKVQASQAGTMRLFDSTSICIEAVG